MSYYFLEERVRELVCENILLKKQIEVMETVVNGYLSWKAVNVSIDKEKLLQYLKEKHAYNNSKSGILQNLIYDISSGCFDLKVGE